MPPAVAATESVIEVPPLMALMVAPAGMPVPVTSCPTTRPDVLPMAVTTADPLESVPLKTYAGE